MQANHQNRNYNPKDKNTFYTDSSKPNTDIDPDQNFKIERQKYLEQRRNQKRQVKQIRKQQHGSSSSSSQKSQQKSKQKPKIVKDFQLNTTLVKQQPKAINEDQKFRLQRQKYLQQRKNQRKQLKQIRKQKYGSSSSQSQKSLQKQKPKPKIVKDFQVNKINENDSPKIKGKQSPKSKNQEEQFHAKHQAYIQQKLARKKQMIEQRKKQFPSSSSSDSDEQFGGKKVQSSKMSSTSQKQKKSQRQQIVIQQKPIPMKRSMVIQSNQAPKSPPIIVQQIIYTKGQKAQQSKKLTILIQSKKNLQWIQQTLIIQNKRIKFINQNMQFMIGYINKIKLFYTKINKNYLKMKITYKDDDYFFGVNYHNKIDNVDQYYYVFSRIVQEKLLQIGFQPKKNQSTIFPNYMNLKDVPMHLKNTALVYGNIMKKSQILGNWQTRFVYITQKQIGSSKKPNQKPSMIINNDSISELWSRFDIQGNNMLNIKIMYNSGTKTQFGIPISNLTDQFNWLYCFYRIINKRES